MNTAGRIIQLLNDRVSQEPLGRISMSDGHEIEIASQLFDALKSILTSSSYTLKKNKILTKLTKKVP